MRLPYDPSLSGCSQKEAGYGRNWGQRQWSWGEAGSGDDGPGEGGGVRSSSGGGQVKCSVLDLY